MTSFNLVKPYFYQRRYLILCGVLCLMVVDTLQLLIPRIVKQAVDGLAELGLGWADLGRQALAVLGIALTMLGLRFIWRRLLIGTSRVVEKGLRDQLFAHIQTLSAGYFDRTKAGDIMAHATNDINHIRMSVGMGMVALTDAVFLGSMAVGFMAYINMRLTLLALIPMPLMVWMTRGFGKTMHRRYTLVQGVFSDITETVRESFAGIRIVKAFNREAREAARVERVSKTYIRENLKLMQVTGAFFPLMVLFTNLSQAIVLFVGGRQAILFEISPGDLVAFISYLNILTWPMMALGWLTNLIQRGAASLDRIQVILDARPEQTDPQSPKTIAQGPPGIAFEKVGFAHVDGRVVLEDIQFEVPPGRVLGIVGPQGCGKTTLLNLIPRRYDVSSGCIRVNGEDIRDVRLSDLRGRIGFVSQEPFLFSGTIRDNLTFGAAIPENRVFSALEAAALGQTVAGFPKGLDTVVGEKGVVLSGGQKQRMVLARALLPDPPLLLLDDPVGQVDTRTARAIINHLKTLAGQKTIVIVSHRLSAVSFADQIMVMKEGRVAALGDHEALMARGGYYAQTHRLQQAQQPEDLS